MQDPDRQDRTLLSRLGRWTRKQFARESDDPDRLHRLRVLFAFGGTTFVLSLAWSVLHFLDGSRIVGSILLSDAVVILGIFAKLRHDKKLTAASHTLMIMATATTVFVTLLTGGLRLTNVTVFFMPLVASIFLLGKAGIVYAVLNVLAPLGVQVAQWTGHTFSDSVPPEGREMDAFLTWIVSMFVVLLFVLSYERARVLSIRKLEQASRAKTQFLANMSHEIRTPLHVIMGLNTILVKSGLAPDQLEYVRTCQQNSEVLLALLNDVLDLSKIEHGGFTLEMNDFDPVDVARSVSDILRYRCEEKGLDLAFDADPAVPPSVRGDHQRLRQVLMNLGGNAVKYTDEGSVRLSIQPADGTEEPHRLRFLVRDTGVGIGEQDRERVFQSFTQVDGSLSRRHEGAGLGLFISSEIVRLMGGRIDLESRPGEGSTFSVEIPFEPPTNGTRPAQDRSS